jgi:hypothetical protein
MEDISEAELLISALRAMQFNIIPKVRRIYIKYSKSQLNLHCYVESELIEDEKDLIYSIGAEIDGDFPQIKKKTTHFIHGDIIESSTRELGQLIYARAE